MQISSRQAPRLPDLVISKFEPKEPLNELTDRVTLNLEIANNGTAPAGPFSVEVSVEGDEAQKTAQLKSLAAGASAKVSLGPLPLHWNGQSMLILDANVDPQNQVQESNEDNNWSKLLLTAPQPPDPWPPGPWPPVPPPPVPH